MTQFKNQTWTPMSWASRTALQQPQYDDVHSLAESLARLREMPPLVHVGEIKSLKSQIAEASEGRRFILQGGDCAERFVDCTPKAITDKLKIILQMSLILVYGLRKPVVRIGRIAGQYAKPRSEDFEMKNGLCLPSFRGDIINGYAFESESRRHDPQRLVKAATMSCFTINWIRALIEGGFADVRRPEIWKLDHISESKQPQLYTELSERVRDATRFMELIGGAGEYMRRVDFFTSHEALLLDYESAFTQKIDGEPGWYNLGAHMLWLGERTRQIDGAHAHYLSGIENPVGIKIGPTSNAAEIVNLVKLVNPNNEPGKITLITRMGHKKASGVLSELITAIKNAKLKVTWSCDPMHGNAIKAQNGIKTRDFSAILGELIETEECHRAMGSILGGVHFELTGENVTECLGGGVGLSEDQLVENYQSYCDPRLNYSQSLEIAYLISGRFSK